MIPEGLARRLVLEHVPYNGRLLDPFCGTGRTLTVGAGQIAEGVGFDINPLAILITRAKRGNPHSSQLRKLLAATDDISLRRLRKRELKLSSVVRWFPLRAEAELCSLLDCINKAKLTGRDLELAAVILSATIRDVSYARMSGWKLHRISASARRHFFVSPVQRFRERMQALTLGEAESNPRLALRSFVGDSRNLRSELRERRIDPRFDAVITSPPYGDSRTTVQYGGITRLVWPILERLDGLDSLTGVAGNGVDAQCLGRNSPLAENWADKRYWKGGSTNPRRRAVGSFLLDMEACLEELSHCVKRRGKIVLVVANRRVGSHRQNLDAFCADTLTNCGMTLLKKEHRRILNKLLPSIIRVNGASRKGAKQFALTMRTETVLVFQNPRRWAQI
jgi:site-specific DNA-methyltransferase (cytosine-N4-specific)